MGENTQDGREHAGIQRDASRNILCRRSRLCGRDQQSGVGQKQTMDASRSEKRYAALYLSSTRRDRIGTESDDQGELCVGLSGFASWRTAGLDGECFPEAMEVEGGGSEL